MNYLDVSGQNCSDKLLFVGQASVAVGTMLITLGLILKFKGQVVVPSGGQSLGGSYYQ